MAAKRGKGKKYVQSASKAEKKKTAAELEAEQRLQDVLDSFKLGLGKDDLPALLSARVLSRLIGMTEGGLERRRNLRLRPRYVNVGRLVKYPVIEVARWTIEGDGPDVPTLMLMGADTIHPSREGRERTVAVLTEAIRLLQIRGELPPS